MHGPRQRVLFIDTLGYDRYGSDSRGPSCLVDSDVLLLTRLDGLPAGHRPELRRVFATDATDCDALRDAARFLVASDGGSVDRVVAVAERRVLLAASLRDEFDLPGPRRAQMLLFRDKVLMKTHLASHGIRVPPYAEFSVAAGLRLLQDWDRVIVKPRLEAGSIGVHAVASAAQLLELAPRILASDDEYEVEAFIDGRLFHVDSLVVEGRAVVATAGESLSPTDNVTRLLPYKDVSVEAGPLLDSLLDFNTGVLAAYPDFTGVTHAEMFVDSHDRIYFCEIGGRPGGGGTSPGFERRTGIDLFDWSIRAQVGADLLTPSGVDPVLTGYTMIYRDPRSAPPVRPEADWVVDVQWPSAVGRADRPPRSWSEAAMIVTVEGRTPKEIEARLDQIAAQSRRQGNHHQE